MTDDDEVGVGDFFPGDAGCASPVERRVKGAGVFANEEDVDDTFRSQFKDVFMFPVRSRSQEVVAEGKEKNDTDDEERQNETANFNR